MSIPESTYRCLICARRILMAGSESHMAIHARQGWIMARCAVCHDVTWCRVRDDRYLCRTHQLTMLEESR